MVRKCLNCESDDLFFYKEVEKVTHHKINKNGTIRKVPYFIWEGETEKEYVECKNCQSLHDYDVDEKGRIIELYPAVKRW